MNKRPSDKAEKGNDSFIINKNNSLSTIAKSTEKITNEEASQTVITSQALEKVPKKTTEDIPNVIGTIFDLSNSDNKGKEQEKKGHEAIDFTVNDNCIDVDEGKICDSGKDDKKDSPQDKDKKKKSQSKQEKYTPIEEFLHRKTAPNASLNSQSNMSTPTDKRIKSNIQTNPLFSPKKESTTFLTIRCNKCSKTYESNRPYPHNLCPYCSDTNKVPSQTKLDFSK